MLDRPPALDAALDLAPLQSGQIVVWVSAPPRGFYSAEIIAESFARDFPKASLVQVEIPRDSFVDRVRAKAQQQPPPDLAFVANHAQVQPLLDAHAVWLSWGRPRFATNGWWMIFKDATHLAQARAFIRWLSRAPGWQPSAVNTSMSSLAIETVQKISIAAVHAMSSGDQAGLEAQLDKDAARVRPPLVDRRARVSDVRSIFTFGNARIAFVGVSAFASGDTFFGVRHMVFILRNDGTGWRILQMDPDARMPARSIDATTPLLRWFDSHIVSERTDQPPSPAVLVDPPDRAVVPRFPQRPDISWRSEARADVSFIVESQFADPGDERNWSASSLDVAHAGRAEQPFREQAPFGAGKQPHRWRVWSLAPSGAISVSSWRTVLFSN
jgi:hypothetical protein